MTVVQRLKKLINDIINNKTIIIIKSPHRYLYDLLKFPYKIKIFHIKFSQ